MVKLINRTDINQYRQISKTVNDKILSPHIIDAQFVDIQNLMGIDFYNDMIRNFETAPYPNLLTGGTYTYQSVTYTHVGLKVVLVHYAFARYVLNGSAIDTPFSFVEKMNSENSKPVSYEAKRSISKMNQQVAFNYWQNVQAFLNRNRTDYPLWKKELCTHSGGNFRISKIG